MRALLVAAVAFFVCAAGASAARLTQADRAAINRTLDGFVNSAVKRKDVGASYDLVTPQFRGGLTRREWTAGNVPAYPFAARGTRFHQWTVEYVDGNEVGFQLMLTPRNRRADSLTFNGAVKKIHGRWLVDGFTPVAAFATSGAPKVVGPHDFTAPGGGDGGRAGGQARLGSIWMTVPAILLGLGVFAIIGFFLFTWFRGRRFRPDAVERTRYDAFAERLTSRDYNQRL